MLPIETLNRTLFLKLNAGAGAPPWLIDAAIGVADYLIYLIPLVLLGMWLAGGRMRRDLALKAVLVTLLALGMNQLIGLVWQHPRPFVVGIGHTWIAHAADSSFPSDHMTVFAAIGLSLLFAGAVRLAVAVLAAGCAVAWARIFLGVHFPLDMAGAVAVAAVAHAAVAPLWRVAGGRLTDWAEQLYRALFARPIAAKWVRR